MLYIFDLMAAVEKVEAKIKATDMVPEDVERVKELLQLGLKESIK